LLLFSKAKKVLSLVAFFYQEKIQQSSKMLSSSIGAKTHAIIQNVTYITKNSKKPLYFCVQLSNSHTKNSIIDKNV
jgi:hypothetical protein